MPRGSLSELSTQIEIAHRLGFAGEQAIAPDLVDRTFARLNALIRTHERSIREPDALPESQIPNLESHARSTRYRQPRGTHAAHPARVPRPGTPHGRGTIHRPRQPQARGQ